MKQRVTQREIALEAGVDVSTVSLCLNAHPRIPQATRERVVAIATRLGYRRDPALSAIAASRWSKRRDDTGLVIAFVVDDLKRAEIELRLYLEGVRAQAEALGYRVEPFQLSRYPDVAGLQRVIRARGIRGCVIGQSRTRLPGELFTQPAAPSVLCGYLRDVPGDVVRPDLRLALVTLVNHLSEQFRRIACLLPIEPQLHSDRVILGAALATAKILPRGRLRVLPCPPTITPQALAELEAVAPEAVVTINERHAGVIAAKTGLAPGRLYTVHTLPPFDQKRGIDLRLSDVGRAAMNLLEIKLRHQPLAAEPFTQSLLVTPRLL